MNIKLIYDISVIGMTISAESSKTGVYRVIVDLLEKLKESQEIEINYTHTGFIEYISNSKNYLEEHENNKILCNKLKYNLPKNIFGRGAQYVNKLYQIFNIDINGLSYNKMCIENAHIFHTPFTKIPKEIKKYRNLKRVITIYDIIPILFPEYFYLKNEMQEIIESIGKDYAVCISNYTRNDLLNYDKNLIPENVFVVYLAADPKKFYPCNNNEKFLSVKSKYKLPDKYFLSLCTLEPRKNLDHLIRSFIRFISDENIHDIHLVLVGAEGWKFEKIYNEINNSEKFRNRIIITGRVPDEDLASIYSHAHSFYYMSLYEGFGLPPLEAMQCGVATVTSNASSLPEVVGDGGIMLEPRNEDDLCNTMHKLYFNDRLRIEYQAKALKQAKLFSWEKCAKDYIDIYKRITEI